MTLKRRTLLAATVALGFTPGLSASSARNAAARPLRLALIEAPSNLGLRPPRARHEPGAWRAPAALVDAGLQQRLAPVTHARLPRPRYDFDAQVGTRIRNGNGLREFSAALANEVEGALAAARFPLVIGGDCSVLLGCLLGLRRQGGRGLVHVDGHSDFSHPGNYDAANRLGSVAGMDLALATGRGEPLLTRWPGVEGALVADEDTIQVGERNSFSPGYTYSDIAATQILRITVQALTAHPDAFQAQLANAATRLATRNLTRVWLHVDLDVLDQAVMPAVDSPGRPGLNFAELARLIRFLIDGGRIAGSGITIYDPDLDPTGRHARGIVDCLASAFGGSR